MRRPGFLEVDEVNERHKKIVRFSQCVQIPETFRIIKENICVGRDLNPDRRLASIRMLL